MGWAHYEVCKLNKNIFVFAKKHTIFSDKILSNLKQPLGPDKDNMTNHNHTTNAGNFTTCEVLFRGKQSPISQEN